MTTDSTRFTPGQLRRIKLFSEMTEDDLALLNQYVEPVRALPNQAIVRMGDSGDCMYLAMEGTFRVSQTRQGKETILATLEAGEFFGELCLLDASSRSADVVASAPGLLLKFPKSSFDQLVQTQPRVAVRLMMGILRTLGSRLRQMDKKHTDSMLLSRAWQGLK